MSGSTCTPYIRRFVRTLRPLPQSRTHKQVLLVGGATRMPAIRRFVRNMTGLDPAEFVVDPDLVRLWTGWVGEGCDGAAPVTCSGLDPLSLWWILTW